MRKSAPYGGTSLAVLLVSFSSALSLALALPGCGGSAQSAPPRGEASLDQLRTLEEELRENPSAGGTARNAAAPDPREEERVRALCARARELRAAQDAAHTALRTSDAKKLEEFAELYRPASENRPASEHEEVALENYLYGRALLLAQKPSEAHYRYRMALDKEPRFSVARAAMGLYHFRFEDWAEAEQHLAQAWKEDRTDPEVAFYLAYTYDKLGQGEKAYTLMHEALASGRGVEPAALWLAHHHRERKELEEVVRILEPVVAKYPENDELRLHLAAAYEELGRIVDAIGQLAEMLPRLKGGWLQIWRYGELLRRADRFAEAEEQFLRVLNEAPEEFFEKQSPIGRAALEQRLKLVQQEKALGKRLVRSREELLAIVKNPSLHALDVRVDAAQALANERPPADGNALGELVSFLVKDPDPAVRIWAPRALRLWAVQSQAEVFLVWLAKNEKESPDVRAACCEAFEAGASDAAVDVLLDCLGAEPVIFHAADDALQRITGMIGVVGDGSYLDEKPEARQRVQREWREKVQRWRERRK